MAPLERDTCRAFYERTYRERYREDLEIVLSRTPPFVTPEDLCDMQRYATELDAHVSTSPLFNYPADRPTHTDVWLNNLLITEDDRWYLLDWDDLQLGDPVLDVAMVGGPTFDDLERCAIPAAYGELSNAEAERAKLYHRMMLLDWAIDTLADWIDAAKRLSDASDYRAKKRDAHERALALYRDLYAG
ncbi:MAG: phosphotransferase family protein [Gemmatimonadales bacterium]